MGTRDWLGATTTRPESPPPFAQTYKNWQRLDKSLSALLGLTIDRTHLVDTPENISIDAMYDFPANKLST